MPFATAAAWAFVGESRCRVGKVAWSLRQGPVSSIRDGVSRSQPEAFEAAGAVGVGASLRPHPPLRTARAAIRGSRMMLAVTDSTVRVLDG